MAFTDDTRKAMLDQHATTTRILNEIKSMADELLLPEIPIAQRKDELNDVFKDVNNDSKCVMSWIVFLFRIKRGGASGPPTQEKYDDVCKKISIAIDNHPQELLETLGVFGKAMNEMERRGGKKGDVGARPANTVKKDSNTVKKDLKAPKDHLTNDDGPHVVCNTCGRKSWGAKAGERCNMPQPNGIKCTGRFIR